MDEHLNDGNPDEGDQITCGDCGRAFLQQFCYRVHKQCELNGPYANYCDFLASYSITTNVGIILVYPSSVLILVLNEGDSKINECFFKQRVTIIIRAQQVR